MAVASGVLDKSVNAIYEARRRPAEKIHEPWRQRLLRQATGGLNALEQRPQNPWLQGERLTMADITTAVTVTFLQAMLPELIGSGLYPKLHDLTARAEALPAFQAHKLETP